MTDGKTIHALGAWFQTAFRADELVRELRGLCGNALVDSLPTPDKGAATVAHAAAVACVQHGVTATLAFWKGLAGLRPQREAEVVALAARFGCTLPPFAARPPPAPTAESRNLPPPPPHVSPPLHPWFFAVGGITLALALGLVVWGFSIRDLSPDQRGILNVMLALSSGFSAGSFVGGMTVRASSVGSGIATSAVGGFGVFLLLFSYPPFNDPINEGGGEPTPTPHACPADTLPMHLDTGAACVEKLARGVVTRDTAAQTCLGLERKLCREDQMRAACKQHGDITLGQADPEFLIDNGSLTITGCVVDGASPWPETAKFRCCVDARSP